MFTLIFFLLFTKCIVAVSDCDWVKIIHQKMGGNVSLNPQNCCKMNGVACLDGNVIAIYWINQNLKGLIPPEIGNLVKLQRL